MATDYCNSFKSREKKAAQAKTTEVSEKPKKKVAVTGNVKRKKKSEFQKFKENMLGDGDKSLKNYVVDDIILPTVQRMFVDVVDSFSDAVMDGLQMSLFGEVMGSRSRGGRRRSRSRMDYRGISERRSGVGRDDFRSPRRRMESRSDYDFEELTFEKRSDAQAVLEDMIEEVETSGLVTVGDLYEFAGMVPESTDYNYCWTSLRNARVVTDRDGFRLSLPYVKPVD